MNEEKYLAILDDIIIDPEGMNLPKLAPLVAMWLRDFRPGDPAEEHEFDRASDEIAQDLVDTALLTTNEVAAVLLKAGYRIRRYPGGALWSMTYVGTD